jgi:hypothetical protein
MHNLRQMRVRRRYVLATGLVICATAVFFGTSSRGHSASIGEPVTVAGVSPSTLSGDGLDLTTAQTATPSSGGQAAAAAASQRFGGRNVVDEQYAHCVEPGYQPPVSQDCWVVALDPSGMATSGIGGATSQPLKYFFVLIDPAADKFIGGMGGAD